MTNDEKHRDPEPWSDSLKKFSDQLATRYPGVTIKRYVLPTRVRELREVFMRELSTRDVIEAAIFADGLMSGPEKSNERLTRQAEERECIRIAIVGIGKHLAGDGEHIAYVHINDTQVPFGELTNWGKRVMDALSMYYNDVNGLPLGEFLEGLKGAQMVGAFALPDGGIPASASHSRRDG